MIRVNLLTDQSLQIGFLALGLKVVSSNQSPSSSLYKVLTTSRHLHSPRMYVLVESEVGR